MVLLINHTKVKSDSVTSHHDAVCRRPLAALVPAFPHVVWLQGDGQLFSSLAAQMSLKGYPQLLLFEDGLLKVISQDVSDHGAERSA